LRNCSTARTPSEKWAIEQGMPNCSKIAYLAPLFGELVVEMHEKGVTSFFTMSKE